MSEIHAVIFDFDGVFADTEPLHHARFAEVIEPFGVACSWERYQQRYIGYDDRDLFRTAFRDAGLTVDERTLHRCVREKAEAYERGIEEEGLDAFPGVIEFVEALSEAGLPLAICSGALRSDILPALRLFGLQDRFAVISTAEDVPVSKPDPAPYEHAFAKLNERRDPPLAKASCVVFEDTETGVEAARAAGLPVVGVLRGAPAETLARAHAHIEGFEGLTLEQLERLLGEVVG